MYSNRMAAGAGRNPPAWPFCFCHPSRCIHSSFFDPATITISEPRTAFGSPNSPLGCHLVLSAESRGASQVLGERSFLLFFQAGAAATLLALSSWEIKSGVGQDLTENQLSFRLIRLIPTISFSTCLCVSVTLCNSKDKQPHGNTDSGGATPLGENICWSHLKSVSNQWK